MKILRLALLPVLAVLALAVTACGGSSGAAGDLDPATRVPASSPLYGEIVVRPDAEQASEINVVAKKLLDTDDPGAALIKLFDEADKGGADVTFARDVDPWLGDRIGFALTSLQGGKAEGVAIIASKDDEKAKAALAKSKDPEVDREYKGVSYRFDPKGKEAYAVFDHAVVVGTESGLKASIDASKGDSLAETNRYKDARSALDEERLGLIYGDLQGLLQLAAAKGSMQALALPALQDAIPRAFAAGVDVESDIISVDAVTIGTPRAATTGRSGATALAALPGNAWLGLGIGGLGATLDKSLDQLSSGGGISGAGVEALLGQLRTQLGIDLRQDVLGWMGDAGIYVAGDSMTNLHGALVIDSTNPAATRTTLQRLAPVLNATGGQVTPLQAAGVDVGYSIRSAGSPPIDVAAAGSKFVIAVGAGALEEAIGNGETLGRSTELTAATPKLGEGIKPSFFLSMPQVTALLASAAGNDPDFQQAKRYLDAFGAVVAGAKDEGNGITRARIVATLR